jgi:transposase
MSKVFIKIDRLKNIEMPPDLEGWVKSDSLARFVVDIIDKIDTKNIEDEYKIGGSDAYPPKMLLSLLLYCYAKGIFSSRKIEAAIYELIPVIYIANSLHPDHTSISNFRKNFLKQIEELFVQFLKIATEMGI